MLGEEFNAERSLESIAGLLEADLKTAIANGELPPGGYPLTINDSRAAGQAILSDPQTSNPGWGLIVRPREHSSQTLSQLWKLQSRYNSSWPRVQDVEEPVPGVSCLTWYGWFHWWVEVPEAQADALLEEFRVAG